MKTKQLIHNLNKSNLWAECPNCNKEFKLSKTVLFDGTRPFPPEALGVQKKLKEEIKDREAKLKKRKKLATERAQITTTSVNIGKSVEKIFPTLKDFKLELPDCRFLGDPIDLVTFNGFSRNKVESISFIEVKSGGGRLNDHQESIRDAIEEKKLFYEVFK